jgi:hypothetical protein
MRAMIDECRRKLAHVQRWRDDTEHRLGSAEAALVDRARELAGSATVGNG